MTINIIYELFIDLIKVVKVIEKMYFLKLLDFQHLSKINDVLLDGKYKQDTCRVEDNKIEDLYLFIEFVLFVILNR
jgi:hypothetical protein